MQEGLLHRLQRFSIRHSIPVMVAVIVISVIFGYFMLQVEINPEIEKLVPEDKEVDLLNQKYDSDGEIGEYMILAVTSEEPFTLEGLSVLSRAADTIASLPEVRSIIQPFSMVTFQKSGRRLEMLTMSPGGKAPETEEDLVLFRQRILSDPFAEKLVISQDGKTLSFAISTYKRGDYSSFMVEMDRVVAELDNHYTARLTGHAVLSRAVKSYLTRDLSRVLFLAIFLILIIYYLGYRALRAPLITLAVVGMGTIWCIGTMSLLGYTITVISITTPPLVLTLGSSYSIHLLNQYYRGTVKDTTRPRLWIADTVVHVNRTVLIAAGTTIIGFLSLLATKLEATREFGISTSLGIVYCALLSFFFLPALLNHLPVPSAKHQKMVKEGMLARILGRISVFVQKRRVYILLFFVAVIAGFALTVGKIRYETEVMGYFPQKEKVIQDTMFIAEQIGGYQQFNLTLTAPEYEKNYFLKKEVLDGISTLEDALNKEENITKVLSFVSYLKNLNSIMFDREGIPERGALIKLLSRYIKSLASQPDPDETITLMANEDFSRINLSIWVHDQQKNSLLADEQLAGLVDRIKGNADTHLLPEIEVDLWGESLNYISLSNIIRRDQRVTTVLSFLFVFLLTALAFKSVKFGLYSLVPMATGILINMIFMALVGIPMDMTTVMFSIVVVGVGVDNAIHLILQYRKQVAAHPGSFSVVLENTLKIAGRPIVITSISILAGFLIFSFASFKPIIYFGLLVAMALFTAALGTIVILPAILSLGQVKK